MEAISFVDQKILQKSNWVLQQNYWNKLKNTNINNYETRVHTARFEPLQFAADLCTSVLICSDLCRSVQICAVLECFCNSTSVQSVTDLYRSVQICSVLPRSPHIAMVLNRFWQIYHFFFWKIVTVLHRSAQILTDPYTHRNRSQWIAQHPQNLREFKGKCVEIQKSMKFSLFFAIFP